jgi:cytochrome c oxidase assembly protein subunit 15
MGGAYDRFRRRSTHIVLAPALRVIAPGPAGDRLAPRRAFAFASGLGLTTALLTFALIIVGSVVRTTGSGLACPDWPLCQGRIIPPLQFNVLVEWSHRLIALLVSLAVLTIAVTTVLSRALRPRLGLLAGLAVLLLIAQVLLGALTVWKLLDPSVVSGHLGVAMLLFVTLLAYTMKAGAAADEDEARAEAPTRPAGLLPLAATATVLTYAQALLGGMVSTNHAGLACPEWPTCNGAWFPPLDGLVGLQMMHRYGAYTLTAVMLALATATRTASDPAIRAGGRLALTLVVAQALLGVSNVYLGLPVWLSAAHLATAVALLAIVLVTTWRVAALPARDAETMRDPVRGAAAS